VEDDHPGQRQRSPKGENVAEKLAIEDRAQHVAALAERVEQLRQRAVYGRISHIQKSFRWLIPPVK